HHKTLEPNQFCGLVSRIHDVVNLESVRLTGGEPLLYKPVTRLVSLLRELGIPKVKLTTNGSLLAYKAKSLKDSGLEFINVSLDALDPDVFRRVTPRGHLDKVLKGIDTAIEIGLKVKINCMVMKGVNESQILPLLRFAGDRGITIRFLELMKMGYLYHDFASYLFSEEDILNEIAKGYSFVSLKRKESSTARYWETMDHIRFGIIANDSSPFCSDCNRLRLSHDGKIYGCLSVNQGFSLIESNESPLGTECILMKAMGQKQDNHFVGSPLSMKAIGG
ncbi:MAG TPA: radical SAM protein, partial [Spirochaetes bacterium]|nr:radical SAM protein [Spirochaetota bacterium]